MKQKIIFLIALIMHLMYTTTLHCGVPARKRVNKVNSPHIVIHNNNHVHGRRVPTITYGNGLHSHSHYGPHTHNMNDHVHVNPVVIPVYSPVRRRGPYYNRSYRSYYSRRSKRSKRSKKSKKYRKYRKYRRYRGRY